MATTPGYANSPKHSCAQLSVANANRDGTGDIQIVFTAATAGSRIDTVHIKAVGTTTAGMVRLYLYDGTYTRLWAEVPIGAVTPSATVPAFDTNLNSQQHPDLLPLLLANGQKLQASTEKAEVINVLVTNGADL
jgi:hypothetical protein